MSLFALIPNKKPIEGAQIPDVWPLFDDACEMNLFFREFDSAEGWLGKGYLAIWNREEIVSLRDVIKETYPEKYHFFASDGGGTQFGFFVENSTVNYMAAPDIGAVEDILMLGNWGQFIKCVQENDYI